jgi:hypothetical protein
VLCIWDCQLHFVVISFLKFGLASVVMWDLWQNCHAIVGSISFGGGCGGGRGRGFRILNYTRRWAKTKSLIGFLIHSKQHTNGKVISLGTKSLISCMLWNLASVPGKFLGIVGQDPSDSKFSDLLYVDNLWLFFICLRYPLK